MLNYQRVYHQIPSSFSKFAEKYSFALGNVGVPLQVPFFLHESFLSQFPWPDCDLIVQWCSMYFMKHVQETESYVNVQYSKIFQDLPRYSLTPRSLAKFSGSTWFDVLKFKGHLESSRAAEWLRLFGYRHYTKFCRKSADRCVADWWFGTWVLFFHMYIYIYGIIIPTDELISLTFIFFRGVGQPPTR